MLFLLVLVALVAADVSKCIGNKEMVNLFGDWVVKFNKKYANGEHSKRYLIFCENVHKVMNLKKQAQNDDSWDGDWLGITQFMDMSPDEFRSTHLSKAYTPEEMRKGKMTDYKFGRINDIPANWNWNDHGAVTHVKNQGSCGSCWAFSATGNMEGQWFKANGTLPLLSEQQIVDCDKTSDGCQGGLMDNAFKYVIGAGGVESENAYPYEGYNEDCKFDKSRIVATFSGFEDLPKDEGKLQEWSYSNGPIAVAMDAILLQFYFGGIFDPPGFLCPGSELDHGVLIVGWGTEKGIIEKKKDFWIVKNSWGPTWGEKGFFKIKRGDGKCGINTCASSAKV